MTQNKENPQGIQTNAAPLTKKGTMAKTQNLKLNRVLGDNRTAPLILAGLTTAAFANGILLPADTDEGALHPSGAAMPPWLEAVQKAANEATKTAGNTSRHTTIKSDGKSADKTATDDGACYLVIDGLDTVSQAEQEKFLPLLKDRRAGMFKLPPNIQIVMPVQRAAAVSKKIKAVSLMWEVK